MSIVISVIQLASLNEVSFSLGAIAVDVIERGSIILTAAHVHLAANVVNKKKIMNVIVQVVVF